MEQFGVFVIRDLQGTSPGIRPSPRVSPVEPASPWTGTAQEITLLPSQPSRPPPVLLVCDHPYLQQSILGKDKGHPFVTPPNHGSLSQTLPPRCLMWEGDRLWKDLSPSSYSSDSIYKAWDPLV